MRLTSAGGKRVYLLWLFLFLGGSITGRADGAADVRDSLDTSIVLQVGANNVSRYGIDKNLARSGLRSDSGPSIAEAKQRWFELFLAKQVVIAEALALGYDQRPEVAQLVETMERHMLSQSRDPAFVAGRSVEPVSEDRLRQIYYQLQIVATVVGVRLSNAEWNAWKGEKWSGFSSAEKLQRLTDLGRSATDFYRGPLPWPYQPFPEVENELKTAAAESWIEHTERDTTTVIYIVSVDNKNLPTFEKRPPHFDTFAREQLQQNAVRARHSALLAGAAVQLDRDMGAKLAKILAALPPQTPEISREAVESLRSGSLAVYQRGHDTVVVTVEDWRAAYNRQFVRRLPRTLQALFENVRALIAADLDVVEARKQGADQTPQFVEDRRNFLHYQALDLFEKEKLLPRIPVSEDNLRNYYSAHANNFAQPIAAECVALRFETQEKAQDWLKQYQAAPREALTSPQIFEQTEIHVSQEKGVPELLSASDAILHLPVGGLFGPVPSSRGWIVVVKRSTETAPLPYDAVSGKVRALWIRQSLDEEELTLARELCKKFKVRDTIPYAVYGVSDALARPWR